MRKTHLRPLLVAALGACLLALTSQASAWPDKPITLVVPFPPGGSSDAVARAIAPELQSRLGQSVIVDNKPGATGTTAIAQLRRAAPDGYQVLVTSLGPLVIAPHLMKSVQYDASRDLEPITVAVQAPNVLVVPASSKLASVADVIALSKAQPGKVSYSSSGIGSSDHLTAELFWQQTGSPGLHVPYKGGAPAIQDLLGAQVEASFQNVNSVMQHIRSGRLRVLAVTSGARIALLPDVPTLAEAGVADLVVYSWQAVLAPRGLPAEVRDRIHAALVAALNSSQVRAPFESVGFEIVANTPAQFADFQRREFARWKRVIETGRIQAD